MSKTSDLNHEEKIDYPLMHAKRKEEFNKIIQESIATNINKTKSKSPSHEQHNTSQSDNNFDVDDKENNNINIEIDHELSIYLTDAICTIAPYLRIDDLNRLVTAFPECMSLLHKVDNVSHLFFRDFEEIMFEHYNRLNHIPKMRFRSRFWVVIKLVPLSMFLQTDIKKNGKLILPVEYNTQIDIENTINKLSCFIDETNNLGKDMVS